MVAALALDDVALDVVASDVYMIYGSILSGLLTMLRDALPASLFLYRRIQDVVRAGRPFVNCQSSRVAGPVLIATFLPKGTFGEQLPEDFVMGFFERESTEGLPAVLFTSLELQRRVEDTDPGRVVPEVGAVQRMLVAVFKSFRMITPAPERTDECKDADIIRLDCVHAVNMPIVRAAGLIVRDPSPYVRILFHMSRVKASKYDDDLLDELRWDAIRTPDYAEILRTNDLVRGVPAIEGIEPDGWGHTYAATGNEASIGLMGSIGGWSDGEACWPEIDLLKAG